LSLKLHAADDAEDRIISPENSVRFRGEQHRVQVVPAEHFDKFFPPLRVQRRSLRTRYDPAILPHRLREWAKILGIPLSLIRGHRQVRQLTADESEHPFGASVFFRHLSQVFEAFEGGLGDNERE